MRPSTNLLVDKLKLTKCLQTKTLTIIPTSSHARPNIDFVNSSEAPLDFHRDSALVYDNFLTIEEGEALVNDIYLRMRRKRFEKGHWDAVITDYKEVEMSIPSDTTQSAQTFPPVGNHHPLSPESCSAIEKVRDHIEQTHFNGDPSLLEWLPCHAIHLKESGKLSAHVDSVRYSGCIVAGLSLLSSSLMRLKPASPSEISTSMDGGDMISEVSRNATKETGKSLENSGHVDLFLPPLSLYVLTGVSRYRYTHSLLPSGVFSVGTYEADDDQNKCRKIEVIRKDRISVVFRDAKSLI